VGQKDTADRPAQQPVSDDGTTSKFLDRRIGALLHYRRLATPAGMIVLMIRFKKA
jgi:hypothetical protein